MLPLPNYEPPRPPRPPAPPAPPIEETFAFVENDRPSPRVVPMVLWFLWLGMTSLLAVFLRDPGPRDGYLEIVRGIFVANVLLTPGWAALAIRPIAPHLAALMLVYFFVFFIPSFRNDSGELFLIFAIVFGVWSVLRWSRVIAIDLQLPPDSGGSRTPRLADQVQFSLRALILMSAVVALGISLYLFFQDSSGWHFYKVMFFLVVPSELLIFWGVLGRARWYIRLPWLCVAVHHWMLLEVINHGFKSWEELYNWNEALRWLSFPVSQVIGLGILRAAGYRFGIPKPRESKLPVATLVEPQSPWD